MDIDIESYMTSLNLESICRTCLTESEEMASVFSEVVVEASEIDDEMETSFLYEILMNISSIQILTNDGLPNLICKKCMEYASNAFKFKLQCERSEALLQTYAATKIHIKEENDIMKNELVEDVSEQEQIKLKDDSNLDLMPPTIENSIMIQEIIEDGMQETKDEVQDESEAEKVDEDDESNQSICIEEVMLNPNLDTSNMELCDETSQCVVINEDNFEKTENESADTNDAAFVASSEENVRLRQRIAMKKICGVLTLPKSRERKNRSYYYAYKINEEGEKVYSCNFCDKVYKHAPSLTVHLRTHTMERPYLCKLCGKGFKQFTGLKHHMRSHTGETPYACTLCDKKYRQSASLTAHMRIHTGQRPFLCSVCGKGFRQAPDLGYHMRTHTNEKPYMCSVCGKQMTMQCHLVQHMRSHTGERPFPCTECGKAFASSTRLKRHQIIHTGLKPFVCNVCEKAFNRASTLRVHSMTHTDERPHVCSFCGKGFIQAHCLKSHLNTHQK